MGKVSIGGVIVGGITDIVASMVSAGVAGAVFGIMNMDMSSPPDPEAIASAVQNSTGFTVAVFILGALSSGLGGFVSAIIAKREHVLNGALAAWASILGGLFGLFSGNVMPSIVALVTAPVMAALGGYLAKPRGA